MSEKLILIVDDEISTLEMIDSVLTSEGYHVIKASDAIMAIEMVEKYRGRLSAILMDLIMPEHDGFITIMTIKAKRQSRLIPIMALTASSDRDSVFRAIEAGADDYLTKPFDADELVGRVHALCKITDFIKRWDAFAR